MAPDTSTPKPPPSRRPGRTPVVLSVALHVGLVAVVYAALLRGPGAYEMVTYRVELVSPPPQQAGPPEPAPVEPPPVVRQQEQQEPEPEPQRETPTPPEPEPDQQAEPAPPEPAASEPQPKPAEKPPTETPPEQEDPKPSTGARPDPTSAGGEDLDVRIEGEAFPYPGYLENITVQIRRHFRWTGSDRLTASVFFFINRDGSVSDLRVVRGSGNIQFDFEAMAAVEQAGRRGAFGALPDGFQADRLPVSFSFDPR